MLFFVHYSSILHGIKLYSILLQCTAVNLLYLGLQPSFSFYIPHSFQNDIAPAIFDGFPPSQVHIDG